VHGIAVPLPLQIHRDNFLKQKWKKEDYACWAESFSKAVVKNEAAVPRITGVRMKFWTRGDSSPAIDPENWLRSPLISRTSRRKVLQSLGAIGASAILPRAAGPLAQTASQGATTKPDRIDVHQHLFSPTYLSRSGPARLNARSDPALGNWTPAKALDEMGRAGIATAILSIPTGGIPSNLAGEAARTLVRDSNEFGAKLVRDYPGRFGLFASLPLLEQDASLREIEYGYDTLKADGIALMTDYGDKWPGDPAFAPVFEELNRRKAVVFVHPTTPSCCGNLLPHIPASWIEYDFDTMRAVTSLLINGTFTKFPSVRFIFTHSGGTVPVLAKRVSDMFPPESAAGAPNGVEAEIKKLYFDIANGANPSSLAALTKLVPISQLLFGTDFPMVRMSITLDGFRDYKFSDSDAQAINRTNALRLFPRLK
jgi:predicted TIM-barrel fold metal-dependent hydrolase